MWKAARMHWPQEVKDGIRNELSDFLGCNNIKSLTKERAREFLAKYKMEERGFLKLKNIIYNLSRPPRKNNNVIYLSFIIFKIWAQNRHLQK